MDWSGDANKWISVLWTTCHGICCFRLPCFDSRYWITWTALRHLLSTAWSVHCSSHAKIYNTHAVVMILKLLFTAPTVFLTKVCARD